MKCIPCWFGLVLISAVSLPPMRAQAADTSPEALLKRIEDLERRLKIAEGKNDLERAAAGEKSKNPVALSLGSRGLEAQSADTNFTMRIHAHIQADGRFYPG